jgi:uncharacterized protein YjdB
MPKQLASPLAGSFVALAILAGCGGSNEGGLVVSGPPVDQVVVTPIARNILEGETAQLTATVFAADGSEIVSAAIVWSTTDAEIAEVTSTGLVTGISPGAAQITALALSGGSEAEAGALITVEARPDP